MKYFSVCSGIEAATVAWKPIGWEPIGFSEIEEYTSSVLEHHYPEVPNYGNVHDYDKWELPPFDVQVGGTPCQSFSVGGLRGGLRDARGNLALVYCLILKRFKPRWFVWENVPGVLTSSGGRDFRCLLSAMAELGYGFCYRVLDAKFFGVPQSRRRLFVVGYLGDWRPAVQVLHEPAGMPGDTEQSEESNEDRFPRRLHGNTGRNCVFVRQLKFNIYREDQHAATLAARDYKSPRTLVYDKVAKTIRKLTPLESERLMGFPDDYTKIAYGRVSRDNCPDKPRYKALGNSMVVPIMRWIGRRIDEVNILCSGLSMPTSQQ
jgi:DNA (cytosine-5)-methyltransferase 1